MKWIIVLFLVFSFAATRQIQAERIITFPLMPTSAFRKALVASIRLSGASVTYQKLSLQLARLDYLRYHSAAHVFGATVYQLLGNRGIVVCDDRFVFGCFHGFSIVAVKDKGVAAIPKLIAACRGQTGKARGSCLHGIGHGLGEYFGPDRLDEQFDLCASVDKGNAEKGCPGGVIMQYFEYYSRVSMGPPSVELAYRPFDRAKPYGPCPILRAKFQRVCYFTLPGWWWNVIAADASAVADLCQRIENIQHRDSCFEGSGVMIAQQTKDNREETVRLCHMMSAVEAERRCRSAAAAEFWLHPESHQKAFTVCEGLSSTEEKKCLHDAHIVENN
ncbi:hypothetical protein HY086_04025 [Candidatus Gottesmanbacteria bacterium]|nr:hypothetical protein [Candidatus Gottesmanbacteria bacterium]